MGTGSRHPWSAAPAVTARNYSYAAQRSELQRLLTQWVPQLETLKDVRKVRWSIDVDPIDTY